MTLLISSPRIKVTQKTLINPQVSKQVSFTGLRADKLIKTVAAEGGNVIKNLEHEGSMGKRVSSRIKNIFKKENPIVLEKPLVTGVTGQAANQANQAASQVVTQVSATINGQAVPVATAIQAAAQQGVNIAIQTAQQAAPSFTGAASQAANQVASQASQVAGQIGGAIAAIAAALLGW